MNQPYQRLYVGAFVVSLVFAITPLITSAQSISAQVAVNGTTTTQNGFDYGYMYGRGQSGAQSQAITALGTFMPSTFPIPVLFGVAPSDLSPNFGDPRDNGTRTHQGEDIMADKDTPIVSPVAGVVLRNETGVSEGNAVYVAAPGGYTLVYMHLDKFAEGVTSGTVLSPGSLIGYVGNTGDASGGATHLHLEVHDATGTAIDPMPFLKLEFTPAQKIAFLNPILSITSDPTGLAQLLVGNFRSTFVADQNSDIALPSLIQSALLTVPVTTTTSPGVLPDGDLQIGSSGSAVVALQTFLINKATGPAASSLADAGATGYFGTITQSALIEYQTAQNISPANGYYGASTRALVQSQIGTTPVAPVVPPPVHAIIPTVPGTPATSITLTRNLYLGISGTDVLSLQQFLNAHGFTVATTGAGSTGNETIYFGPATQSAVIRFQIAHAIVPAVGYVGPITRAAIST